MKDNSKLDPFVIIKKFYQKEPKLYHILITHSNQVKDKALGVAEKHPELQLNKTFLEEASLLHDIGIFLCYAPDIYCYGTHQYIEHGYLGADLLRKEGLPLHALVAERHTGIGFTKEIIIKEKLPLPHRDMVPTSLEEQVICYADKFFSKSKLTTPYTVEEIREYLKKYGPSHVEKFDEWHARFK